MGLGASVLHSYQGIWHPLRLNRDGPYLSMSHWHLNRQCSPCCVHATITAAVAGTCKDHGTAAVRQVATRWVAQVPVGPQVQSWQQSRASAFHAAGRKRAGRTDGKLGVPRHAVDGVGADLKDSPATAAVEHAVRTESP